MTIRTGIGGWTYAPWRGSFYPDGLRQKDELRYAASRLGAIEINGTFYRLQKPETFANWRKATPEGFVFALKASRFIVSRTRLAEAGEGVERFCGQGIAELGDRLGPILWQMPVTRRFDPDDIAAFFALLPRSVDGLPLRHAIEAGHESFDCPEFVALARDAGVAVAWVDAADRPAIDAQTGPFSYARLKSAQSDIPGGYLPARLDEFATMAQGWAGEDGARDVFLFCINGAKERAPAAAMALAERVGGEQP